MRPILLISICIASYLSVSSCSLIRRTSLGVAAPMFFEASEGFEKDGNWENFRLGIPGNLKLLDGLLSVRPDDTYLLVPAIKGYSGYAFVVNETLYLADKFADKDDSPHLEQALINYSKAFSYGLHFLSLNDITLKDLFKAQKEKGGMFEYLDDHLSDDLVSLEGAVYTAQSLGSLVNLQKSNMQLISYLSIAKGLFDWACTKKPDIGMGICQLFYAAYEASRPKMLGGNPEKGRKIFEKFIKDNPHHWLARVFFIENYAIPMSDENVFLRQKKNLNAYKTLLDNELNWNPGDKLHPAFENKRLRIYQATAIKRFDVINKYRRDIF